MVHQHQCSVVHRFVWNRIGLEEVAILNRMVVWTRSAAPEARHVRVLPAGGGHRQLRSGRVRQYSHVLSYDTIGKTCATLNLTTRTWHHRGRAITISLQ